MRNFYACTNGLKLEWEWQNQTLGSINILSLEKIMGGEGAARKIDWNDPDDHKDYLWFEDFENKDIKFLKKLRPFDRFNGFGDEEAAIKLKGENTEIYYLWPRYEDRKLPLSFEEYLDYLLTFMGLLAWQRFVTEGGDIIIRQKPIKEYLKELFPEIAWERHVRK